MSVLIFVGPNGWSVVIRRYYWVIPVFVLYCVLNIVHKYLIGSYILIRHNQLTSDRTKIKSESLTKIYIRVVYFDFVVKWHILNCYPIININCYLSINSWNKIEVKTYFQRLFTVTIMNFNWRIPLKSNRKARYTVKH